MAHPMASLLDDNNLTFRRSFEQVKRGVILLSCSSKCEANRTSSSYTRIPIGRHRSRKQPKMTLEKPIFQLALFWLCLGSVSGSEFRQDKAEKPFTLKCPDGESVSLFAGNYTRDGADRRRYRIQCQKLKIPVKNLSLWTWKKNDAFLFSCRGNRHAKRARRRI